MKKIIYLYLIFFAFPSLSQTQIGSGSYSTNFPGTDVAGTDITIETGSSTGTGQGGKIIFKSNHASATSGTSSRSIK